jgi:hypothetical protein
LKRFRPSANVGARSGEGGRIGQHGRELVGSVVRLAVGLGALLLLGFGFLEGELGLDVLRLGAARAQIDVGLVAAEAAGLDLRERRDEAVALIIGDLEALIAARRRVLRVLGERLHRLPADGHGGRERRDLDRRLERRLGDALPAEELGGAGLLEPDLEDRDVLRRDVGRGVVRLHADLDAVVDLADHRVPRALRSLLSTTAATFSCTWPRRSDSVA